MDLKIFKRETKETEMTIQKKSLISSLNTTKKAIVASTPVQPVSANEGRSAARAMPRSSSRTTPRSLSRTTPRSLSRTTPRSVQG